MDLVFSGPVWYWRGPAPFHFVTPSTNVMGGIVGGMVGPQMQELTLRLDPS